MKEKIMLTTEDPISVKMRIRDSELVSAVHSYLSRTLHASFKRFAGRMRSIRVTLQDVNGPRGGVDKSCRIEAKLLPSRRRVMQEVRDANIFAAITLAIQRVKCSVRKTLERTKAWHTRRETIRKATASAEEEEGTRERIRRVMRHGLPKGEST